MRVVSSPTVVHAWSDPALQSVDYLSAHYDDSAFPPYFHDGFAIGIIERGAQRFRARRDSPRLMTAGTLCVINPGTVHEAALAHSGAGNTACSTRQSAWLPAHSWKSTGAKRNFLPEFREHVIEDPELFRDFQTLHQASERSEDLLERETRMLCFLRRLYTRHASVAPGRACARQS